MSHNSFWSENIKRKECDFFAVSIRTLNLWIDSVKARLSLRLLGTLNSRPHNSCNNRHCTVVESFMFREMCPGLVMTPLHVRQMASSWKLTFGQHLGRRPSRLLREQILNRRRLADLGPPPRCRLLGTRIRQHFFTHCYREFQFIHARYIDTMLGKV